MIEVLNGRDAALLRAVANGRCELEPGPLPVLYVDGRVCCDTGVAPRLVRAGLVAPPEPNPSRMPARLTEAGRAELAPQRSEFVRCPAPAFAPCRPVEIETPATNLVTRLTPHDMPDI